MQTSWWYESALFDLDNVVALARLTARGDGTAEVLTDAGEAIPFDSRDDAEVWLTSEEYARLESLPEVLEEQGKPIDPRIRVPVGDCPGELLPQMVLKLAPPTKDGTPLTAEWFDALVDPAAMTGPG